MTWIRPRGVTSSPEYVQIFEDNDTKLTADLHFIKFMVSLLIMVICAPLFISKFTEQELLNA